MGWASPCVYGWDADPREPRLCCAKEVALVGDWGPLAPRESWAAAPDAVLCFQLAGGVILGVALWLRHDPQTTNLLYLELGDRPAPNTFYVGEWKDSWERQSSELQAGAGGSSHLWG